MTVTQLFRQECELPGYVRAAHAVAAIQKPDTHVCYELGEFKVILAAKRITLNAYPYTLLIVGGIRDGQTEIFLGFRYYPDENEPDQTESAYDIFTKFLQRYGLPVTVGGQTGMLIPDAVVQLPSDNISKIFSADAQPADNPLVNGFIRIRDGLPRVAEVAWTFAISKSRYASDVARYKR